METGAPLRKKHYVRPIPGNWWLTRPAYLQFMIRELTAGFLGAYAVFLLVLMSKARDPIAFAALLGLLKSPISIALHLVVLAFALFHSVTFFNLTPKVLVLHRGEEKVPAAAISGAHYAAWLVVSLILLALALQP